MCHDRVGQCWNWTQFSQLVNFLTSITCSLCSFHPEVFGELELKRHHGQLPPLIVEHSPLEFPAWTNNPSKDITNITYMPNVEGFADNDLLNPYLNIKQEPEENTEATQPLTGVKNDSSVFNTELPLTSTNEPVSSEHETEPNADTPMRNNEMSVMVNTDDDVRQEREVTLNPISLKENCSQILLNNCRTSSFATLFYMCTDYIAWNLNVMYSCSMILPFPAP